jgi:hypothetical protein
VDAAAERSPREGSTEERAALSERLTTAAAPSAHGEAANLAFATHLHPLAVRPWA